MPNLSYPKKVHTNQPPDNPIGNQKPNHTATTNIIELYGIYRRNRLHLFFKLNVD